MSIRVLHVIGSLRSGGAQVVVKYIVENCGGEFESIVYPLRPRGGVVDIDGEVIERDWVNYNPRKFIEIIRLCKKRQIDILAAHLSKPIMGGLLASYFCDAKVVVHEHGPLVRSGLQYNFYRFMLKRLWRRAAAFVAVSEDMADALVKRIGIDREMIRVVPNAVDFTEFESGKDVRNEMRTAWGVGEDNVILGFVGRLVKVKGVDILLRAVASLPENYVTVVGGTGPEKGRLMSLVNKLGIEERIKFLGFCKDVASVMAGFDVGVMPSRQEPFGIVGLEFMRMGVPVVSSGMGGMGEYMVDGDNALLLKENTPKEVCRSVEKLMQDEQLRMKLIEGGKRTAERYSVERCVRSVEEVYKEVLNP
jgi:teichuronic acid biosynthesis glycosyltransferase TuaC